MSQVEVGTAAARADLVGVAVCASTFVLAGDENEFASKVGTSALREMLAKTCHVRIDVPEHADLRDSKD